MLQQLLYVSRSVPADVTVQLAPIFEASRHNNAIDGVTGLLFSDGKRFVQVLEGSEQAIGATMDRIRADPRHDHLVVLSDAMVPSREFGNWSMADRHRGERADEFDERLRRLLRNASPEVSEAFEDLLQPA